MSNGWKSSQQNKLLFVTLRTMWALKEISYQSWHPVNQKNISDGKDNRRQEASYKNNYWKSKLKAF